MVAGSSADTGKHPLCFEEGGEGEGTGKIRGRTGDIVDVLIYDDIHAALLLPIMGADIRDGKGLRHGVREREREGERERRSD